MSRTKLCKSYLSVALAALMLLAMLTPLVPAVKAEASSSVGSYHVWDFEDVAQANFSSSYAGRLTEDEGPNGAQFVWFESNSSNKEYGTMEIATLADGNKVFKVTANEYVGDIKEIPNVNIYASGGSTTKLPFNADKVSISYKLKVARLVGNEEDGFGDAESGGFPRRSDIYFGSAKTGTDETTAFGIDNGKVYAGGSKYYADNGVGGPVCTTCGSKTNPLMGVADDDGFLNVKTEVDIANRTWQAYYYDGAKWVSAEHLGHDVVYAFSGTNISQFLFQFGYDSTYNNSEYDGSYLVYYLDDIVVSVNDGKPAFSIASGEKGVNVNTKAIDVSFVEKVKAVNEGDIIVEDSEGNPVSTIATLSPDGYKATLKLKGKLKEYTKYTVKIKPNSIEYESVPDTCVYAASSYFYTGSPDDPFKGTDFDSYGNVDQTKTIDKLREDFADAGTTERQDTGTAKLGNYYVEAVDNRLKLFGQFADEDDRVFRTYLNFTDSDNPIKGAIKLAFDVEFDDYFGRYFSATNNAQAPVMEIQDAEGTKIYTIYQNSTNNTLAFVGSVTSATIAKNGSSTNFSADKNYHFEITTSFDGKTATCNVYENGTLVGSATNTATNADSGFARVMMAVYPRYCGYYKDGETRRDQCRIYDNIYFSGLGRTEAYLVNGTTDVEGDDLVIGFATPVNEGIEAKITLDENAVTGTLSEDGYFFTLDPVDLALGSEHTIAIAATEDYFGNSVAAKDLTFTTKLNLEEVDVEIGDMDGQIAPDQELTISATFTNNNQISANVTLFIALYDADGNMLKVAGAENNGFAVAASDEATLTATLKAPSELADGAYIKAFAWTDINDLTPYINAVKFE